MYEIKMAAQIARQKISQIPFAEQERIDFKEKECGDPTVYYEYREGCYYRIVSERGTKYESKVADSQNEMVDYFVSKAIWQYALNYELNHRHKFESNLRQTHTIMEFCYSFIEPRKIYTSNYDDRTHICLDLLKEYAEICKKIKENYGEHYMSAKEDIHFLLERRYASPSGGISDMAKVIEQAHDCVVRIQAAIPESKTDFDKLEVYYERL